MSQKEHANLRGLCKQLKEEFDTQIYEKESYLKHIEAQLSLEQVCYYTEHITIVNSTLITLHAILSYITKINNHCYDT